MSFLDSPFSLQDHLPLPAQLFLVKASVLNQLFFDYTVLGFPVSQKFKNNKLGNSSSTNNLDNEQIRKTNANPK